MSDQLEGPRNPYVCPFCGEGWPEKQTAGHSAYHELMRLRAGQSAAVDELAQIEECLVDPSERRPGRTYERTQEVLMEVRQMYALRARLERVATWADRYDGEIGGTIRDALNLNEPHWSDKDDA